LIAALHRAAERVAEKALVYRIMDFHPECLIAERGRSGLLLGAILRLTISGVGE